jgi:hypothetical protein
MANERSSFLKNISYMEHMMMAIYAETYGAACKK